MLARFIACLLLFAGCSETRPQQVPKAHPERLERAAGPAAVRYRLDFSQRHRNRLRVSAEFSTEGHEHLDLMLPVWAPGSYLVREFSRHIETIAAHSVPGGASLDIRKVLKNRFRVTTAGAQTVRVTYLLYAKEPTVRTNFVDSDYAIISGAATFLTTPSALEKTHSVTMTVPEGWNAPETSLTRVATSTNATFVAESFEALVDSPILLGQLATSEFTVANRLHRLVNTSTRGAFSQGKAVEDVQKLVETNLDFWGGALPYRDYRFLNVVNEARGGLEHKDSTVMMTSQFVRLDTKAYRDWLGLVSHEFFHTWNGKRLRPINLGPFDWEQESYTPDLWIVEGLTSYYDNLMMLRAGLLTDEQYLARLTEDITRLDQVRGRKLQSLAESSYDAWIKFYRSNPSSWNSTISYYRKGSIVGLLLDAALREKTGGGRSLDDVMRLAYARYSGPRGYTSDQFFDLFEEVGSPEIRQLAVDLVTTTKPLDYAVLLKHYGLAFEVAEDKPAAYLGVALDASHGRVKVKKVAADSPADRSGVNVGDELIAIDGIRLSKGVKDVLASKTSTASVSLLLSRRRQLRSVSITLQPQPKPRGKLVREEKPTPRQDRSWRRFAHPNASQRP